MGLATVHNLHGKRMYLRAHGKELVSVAEYFPGRSESKIVPVVRQPHHDAFNVGERVRFAASKRDTAYLNFAYHSVPVSVAIIGVFLSTFFLHELPGVVIMSLLFAGAGIVLHRIIGKSVNMHRKIDIRIHPKKVPMQSYSARK